MTRIYQPPGGEFDYGQVIKDSASLVWRNRFLWFFGLFAGTTSAFGGWSCDYNSYVTAAGDDEASSADEVAGAIVAWLQDHLALVITIAVSLIVLGVILWLWSVFCHGAAIATVRDISLGRPAGFRSALSHGRRNFRLLLPYMLLAAAIPLLAALALAALGALAFLLLSTGHDATELAGALLIGFAALAALAATVSTLGFLAALGLWPVLAVGAFLLFSLGSRAVVLDGLRPLAALRNATSLLLDNLSRSLMLFAISVGISIGATIVAAFAGLLTAIPAVLAWSHVYTSGWSAGGVVIASLLTLPPLVTGLLFTAALNTYFAAYWTEARMLFSGEKKQVRRKAP
ncbi:MAG: hypothetical protein C4534_10565 [Gaiellales bacterium]|nr:MAG: hypothetical protein C4534_10565 [Gaiellales bacterium]